MLGKYVTEFTVQSTKLTELNLCDVVHHAADALSRCSEPSYLSR